MAMATTSVALLLVALCMMAASVNSEFLVKGRVYCDTCRAGFETNVTTYIPGAKVAVQCKDSKSLERVYRREGFTDSTGTYEILVEEDHQDQICECLLVSSPIANCKTADPGRSRSTVVLTRTQNGLVSSVQNANNMGYLRDSPLSGCRSLLKYYLSDV